MAEGHESFGQLLHRRRLAGGWTQEQLAERAGISPEAVGTLERGTRRTPHPGTAARLADALGLTGEDRSAFLAAIRSRIPAEPHSAAPGRTTLPQLPATYSPFIGREQEQAEVLHLLQTSRLLTLTGPGGVGKTRLALAVTAQVAALFPDAACFVPLAGVGDSRHLPAAIADAVDAGSAGTGSVEQRLDRALEGKRMLLVLDNFEHLAAGAPQIAGLLDRHPGITLLVTSRIPLRLRSEHRYSVSPLSVPDLDRDLTEDSLRRHDATALFLDRWRAAGGRGAPDRDLPRTVAEICIRLDGLPLAIELAAARAAALSLPALLSRLTSRLKVLGAGPADAPERHQTLRGAIQWSYALLSRERQALFRRLAVFADGFTLEAVEAVCGEALDGLADLAEANLVRPPGHEGEPGRFSMLATIREYARELLEEEGEAREQQRRHAEHFAALAEDLSARLSTPDGPAALSRLQQEGDDLRAALEWSVSPAGSAALGLRLSTALLPYWLVRGYGAEGLAWLRRFMAMPEEVPRQVQARALHAVGVLAREQGEAGWVPSLEAALPLYRELHDDRGTADVLHALGYGALHDNEYARGLALLEEALTLRRRIRDPAGVAESLGALSTLYGLQNDNWRAIALLEEAAALYRSLGDTPGLTVALSTLAMTLAIVGEVDRAETLIHEVLPLQRELESPTGVALSLYTLGLVEQHRGRLQRALDHLIEAIRLWHGTGSLVPLTLALEMIAGIHHARGEEETAAALLGFVEAASKRLGYPLPPRYRQVHDQNLTAVQIALGDEALSNALARGALLSLDAVVELACAEDVTGRHVS